MSFSNNSSISLCLGWNFRQSSSHVNVKQKAESFHRSGRFICLNITVNQWFPVGSQSENLWRRYCNSQTLFWRTLNVHVCCLSFSSFFTDPVLKALTPPPPTPCFSRPPGDCPTLVWLLFAPMHRRNAQNRSALCTLAASSSSWVRARSMRAIAGPPPLPRPSCKLCFNISRWQSRAANCTGTVTVRSNRSVSVLQLCLCCPCVCARWEGTCQA